MTEAAEAVRNTPERSQGAVAEVVKAWCQVRLSFPFRRLMHSLALFVLFFVSVCHQWRGGGYGGGSTVQRWRGEIGFAGKVCALAFGDHVEFFFLDHRVGRFGWEGERLGWNFRDSREDMLEF